MRVLFYKAPGMTQGISSYTTIRFHARERHYSQTYTWNGTENG